MIWTIKNEFLEVQVNDYGAELWSIKGLKTNTEYLWQGEKPYWGDRATVIFPICGRLYQGKYTYKGKTYDMIIHGFAKKMNYEVEEHTDTKIRLSFASNDFTRAQYPFEFIFKMEYTLEGNTITQRYIVENTDDKEMIFSVGGHPGFKFPFNKGEEYDDYYLEFATDEPKEQVVFSNHLFSGEHIPYQMKDGNKIQLSHKFFEKGLFTKGGSKEVTLKTKANNQSVTLKFDEFEWLGLWKDNFTTAEFACIEPWKSLPSVDGKEEDFETKANMEHLEPNGKFTAKFTISINE